jgi:hypothetical protein
MPEVEAAIDHAFRFLSEAFPFRMERREIVFYLVATTLLEEDASRDERIKAIALLEGELFPKGMPHGGSLARGLGWKGEVPRVSRKRGGDGYANGARDITIANAVRGIHQKFGFSPTRNKATNQESACSIVNLALRRSGIHMSEAAVERIWRKGSKIISRIELVRG